MVESNHTFKEKFNTLSLSEKYTWISDHGKYIGVRKYYNHFINLHVVDESFFKVFYFIPDNHIVKIERLEDLREIDLYINYMVELNKNTCKK